MMDMIRHDVMRKFFIRTQKLLSNQLTLLLGAKQKINEWKN